MRIAATVLAALGLAAAPATTARTVSLHAAKQRTFAALLRMTEQRPDATDTTRADITVAQCHRYGSGWLCHGSLYPVAFSGIDGARCPIVVNVQPQRTRVRDSQCR